MDEKVTFHRIPIVWVPSLEADDVNPIYSILPFTILADCVGMVLPDVIVEASNDGVCQADA